MLIKLFCNAFLTAIIIIFANTIASAETPVINNDKQPIHGESPELNKHLELLSIMSDVINHDQYQPIMNQAFKFCRDNNGIYSNCIRDLTNTYMFLQVTYAKKYNDINKELMDAFDKTLNNEINLVGDNINKE